MSIRCLSLCLVWLLAQGLLAASAFAGDHAHAFIYHRFGEARYPSTNISVTAFAEQLRYLKTGGFQVLPLEDVVERLRRQEALPERCVVLTVDDGYRSFVTGAMPLLRQYGYPVTLFVSTDTVGQSGYLGWDELRQLVQEGVTIGSHSASHDYLLDRRRNETPAQWRTRVRDDIVRGQAALTQHLGVKPKIFAYPFGEFSRELQQIVAELGFVAAMGQQSGIIGRHDPLLALPRFPLGGSYGTLKELQQKLSYRPLPARVIAPGDTLVATENPPRLVLELDPQLEIDKLRCFVNGQPVGRIEKLPGQPRRVAIQAAQPLRNRRDKYTVTAPGAEPRTWYWFSQLWVQPESR